VWHTAIDFSQFETAGQELILHRRDESLIAPLEERVLLLVSVENALSTFDKADLSNVFWRKQEEVLDGLRNKRVFQPYDPDLSL
jgi:hypothetical protein